MIINNKTRQRINNIPFENIKNCVLGKKYELSLVFIGKKFSKNLNIKYRNKNKAANVLSFPLDKNVGEIFITPLRAKEQAKKFSMSEKKFLVFLYIHGLLHLKGLSHGSKMDLEENRILKKFKY